VRRLVEDDGVFLLLNFGGPASVEIAPYAMEKKVPYLFPHTALVSSDAQRYVFTSFPRYEGESLVMLRYLAETRGLRRVAVVHDPNVYGQYFVDRARELGPELGFAFVGHVPIESRQPASALEQARALRELSPDAVVMALYPAQAKKVMEAKAQLDWSSVRMVSSGPLTDEQYLEVEGGASDGTLGFCHYPDPAHDEAPGIDEYRRRMEARHPGHPFNRYSLYGYVFGKLVVEGLRRAGPDLDRERFVEAMESIHDWDSGGVLPKVSFSARDHHAQDAGFICELEGGRFRPLTDWLAP
jgi:ABC-type branched-subunit amino acid transport system substrate-binding protein